MTSSYRRFAELAALDGTIEVFARDGQPVANKLNTVFGRDRSRPKTAH